MKKMFLKMNMAIICLMVLFATSITFADTFTEVKDVTGTIPLPDDFSSYGYKILKTIEVEGELSYYNSEMKEERIDDANYKYVSVIHHEDEPFYYLVIQNENGDSYYDDEIGLDYRTEKFTTAADLMSNALNDRIIIHGKNGEECILWYIVSNEGLAVQKDSIQLYYPSASLTEVSVDGSDNYQLEEGNLYLINTKTLLPGGYTNTSSGKQSEGNSETFFEKIEHILSDFVMDIAMLINYIVKDSMGKIVTIDDIVFNQYEGAKLEFFETDINGQKVTAASSIINDLRKPVNDMYSLFRSIVLVGFMVILVYVGIKIMLSSTTAKKKATYKETFMAWVAGIILLFFMPYYMKYMIAFEGACAEYIGSLRSEKALNAQSLQVNATADKGLLFSDFNNILDLNNVNENSNYMTVLASIAIKTKSLGIAFAYLILTWQVVVLIVYYYKRAFITALLIIIFPLIAFSYVWDKLNDGKSQALSAWIKEFTVNLFVQVFHAIIFVFVSNTIYATLQPASADFILLIIASSFLFTGEDIVKAMFGGGGEALGSAAGAGMKIAAITRGAISIGTRTVHNVVGKDGYVRSTGRSFTGFVRDTRLLHKGKDGQSAFDILASRPVAARRINALLPSEGEITPKIAEAAETIDTLNHAQDKAGLQKTADAMKSYEKLLDAYHGEGFDPMTEEEKNQFSAMLKKCKITPEQLQNMNVAMNHAQEEYARMALLTGQARDAGLRRITQNLTIELEAIFTKTETEEEENKKTVANTVLANRMLQATLIRMRDNAKGDTAEKEAYHAQFEGRIEALRSYRDEIAFAGNSADYEVSNPLGGGMLLNAEAVASDREIYRVSVRNGADNIREGYRRATGDLKFTSEQRKCAESLATLELLATGVTVTRGDTKQRVNVVSAKQAKDAIRYLNSHKIAADQLIEHTSIGLNLDEVTYVVAQKMLEAKAPYANGQDALVDTRSIIEETAKVNEEYMKAVEAGAEEEVLAQLREKAEKTYENKRQEAQQEVAQTRAWAEEIHRQFNEQVRNAGDKNVVQEDPVATIQEIIYAAQQHSPTGEVESTDALLNPDLSGEIYDKKFALKRMEDENARLRRLAFANEMLEFMGHDKRALRQDIRTILTGNSRNDGMSNSFRTVSVSGAQKGYGNGSLSKEDDAFRKELYRERWFTPSKEFYDKMNFNGDIVRYEKKDAEGRMVVDISKVKEERKKVTARREEEAKRILTAYAGPLSSLSSREKAKYAKCARYIATIEMLKEGTVSAREAREAIEYMQTHEEVANALLPYTGTGMNVKAVTYFVADKMVQMMSHSKARINPLMDARQLFEKDEDFYEEYDRAERQYRHIEEEMEKGAATYSLTELEELKNRAKHFKDRLTAMKEETRERQNIALKEASQEAEELKAWAEKMIADTNERVKNQAENNIVHDDPRTEIDEILYAAQQASSDGNVGSARELFRNSVVDQVLEEKFENTRRYHNNTHNSATEDNTIGTEESRTVTEESSYIEDERGTLRRKASEVAALGKHFLQNRMHDIHEAIDEKNEEEPTYNGYTKQEIRQRRNAEVASVFNGMASIGADIASTSVGAMVGGAFGVNLGDGKFAFDEAALGMIGGYQTATQIPDKLLQMATGQTMRDKEMNTIAAKVKKRNEEDEKDRKRALRSYKESQEETAPKDTSIAFYGASANMHQEATGMLSATITIRAEHAEFVSISETQGASTWMPFQEQVLYRFADKDPHKSRSLYIYIADRDANVKGMVIHDVKI